MSKSSCPNGQSFDNGPHYVYRCYSADGALLYVGCTTNPNRRVNAHRSTSAFGPMISRVRVTGPFAGWGRAHAAELAAVWDEKPLYNIQGAHPDALPFAKTATDAFLLERHQRLVSEGRRAA